jgi:hypothetical protein
MSEYRRNLLIFKQVHRLTMLHESRCVRPARADRCGDGPAGPINAAGWPEHGHTREVIGPARAELLPRR